MNCADSILNFSCKCEYKTQKSTEFMDRSVRRFSSCIQLIYKTSKSFLNQVS